MKRRWILSGAYSALPEASRLACDLRVDLKAVVVQVLFDREEWPEDDYRLEVSSLGEIMAAVRFTVGDKDIPGAYSPADFEK